MPWLSPAQEESQPDLAPGLQAVARPPQLGTVDLFLHFKGHVNMSRVRVASGKGLGRGLLVMGIVDAWQA